MDKQQLRRQARHRTKKAWLHLLVFLKWIAIGIGVGVSVGGAGTLFHFTLEAVLKLFAQYGWLVWLLPAAGAAIVWLYRILGVQNDRGANLMLHWVRATNKRPPLRFAPLIFIATALTQLCGGSAGREGAALQMGGCLGAGIGKLLRLDKNDMRIVSMCGMSAAFSALFGTPITAAVFSMEVISVGVLYYAAIVPCVTAALVGAGISRFFGAAAPLMPLEGIPGLQLLPAAQVAVLAVACGILSILFCTLLHKSSALAARLVQNSYLRILSGGLAVALLTTLLGTSLYNGSGMAIVELAAQQPVGWEVFLLKILFTVLTISAGFKGGEIVPTFAVGAGFGSAFGGLLGLSPMFGAGVGLTALFCGVLNCPLTSLVLSVELFGAGGLPYFALAVCISYMLSGYSGLYSEQRILYSKLKTKFINRKAN